MSKKLSITDKAFAAASEALVEPSPPTATSGTEIPKKTSPGVMIAHLDRRSGLREENDRLVSQLAIWEDALPTKLLQADSVVPSRWANRHIDSFKLNEFQKLKDDIRVANGNVQPIKVRPIKGSNPQAYEIVYGHRRHRACLELGIPVLAYISAIDDITMFVDMDRENRQRADLRPYEQGSMYKAALDSGLFATQRLLADAVGVSQTNISMAVRIAELPELVLNAFASPLDIGFRWGNSLFSMAKSSPDVVLERAQAIINSRASGAQLTPHETFNRLTEAHKEQLIEHRSLKAGDKLVAKISTSDGKVSYQFAVGVLNQQNLADLDAFILDKFFKDSKKD